MSLCSYGAGEVILNGIVVGKVRTFILAELREKHEIKNNLTLSTS